MLVSRQILSQTGL